MSATRLPRALVALACVLLATAAPFAVAGVQRTFVASGGSDANTTNNCSLTFPCRSFAPAMTVTNPGGEIIVLDSAGYGPVTITQSVSIIAPQGVHAGISVSSGFGITINGAGIVVVLRGLTINGLGGTDGILIASAGVVNVENCVISNLSTFGIRQLAGTLELKDTIVRHNANVGVYVEGPATANFDHVRLEFNGTGAAAEFGGHIAMQDCLVTGSANAGVVAAFGALGTPSDNASVTITRSMISGNLYGIFLSSAPASGTSAIVTVHVSDSTVSDNGNSGIYATGTGRVHATRTTIVRNAGGVRLDAGSSAFLDGNYIMTNGSDVQTVAGSSLTTRGNNTTQFFVLGGGPKISNLGF